MSKRGRNRRSRASEPFFSFPKSILNSSEYSALSAIAVKLLVDLAAQYNGRNNGDLCAAWKLMRLRGWKSHDTLYRAIKELESTGFLERTRQGGRNRPNLYAISWLAIDYCGGKLDISETSIASNRWKNSVTRLSVNPCPNVGLVVGDRARGIH